MYGRKGRKEKKNGSISDQNKRKKGEVLTSPEKDMYIMHGWEEKNKDM